MPLKYIPQIKKFKNWLIDNPDVIEARRSGATNSLYKSEFTNEIKNVLLPYIKGFIKKNPLNIKMKKQKKLYIETDTSTEEFRDLLNFTRIKNYFINTLGNQTMNKGKDHFMK